MVSENLIFFTPWVPPLLSKTKGTQAASICSCGCVQCPDSCLYLGSHLDPISHSNENITVLISINYHWPLIMWKEPGLQSNFYQCSPLLTMWLRLSRFPFSRSQWTFGRWILLLLSQKCSFSDCCFPVWLPMEQLRKKMDIVSEGK